MENTTNNTGYLLIDEDKVKEKLRKSKSHIAIMYCQMERLERLAEKSENVREQIEITNSMIKILEVISNSIESIQYNDNYIKDEIIKHIPLIQKTIFQDWLKDVDGRFPA
ncbi:MAG: hypothetical protein ACTTHM_07535 [Peptoanaerobacter stomatis]|uniref:hypothetical protein n=1 Tax=Peptoanaerobacter stomatis TaxID=796937 RepID=UPI003F9FCD1F